MESLEQRYEKSDAAERALKDNIWKAAAEFLRRHPEFVPSQANERVILDCMWAPENDHLSPVRVADWEDAYAQCRGKIHEAHAARKQSPRRAAPAAPTVTHEDIDRMTAQQFQRRIETDPKFAAAVDALPPRLT